MTYYNLISFYYKTKVVTMGKIKIDEVYSANIDLFKVINRNSRKTCEICSKLTIKTELRHKTSFWCYYC